MVIHFKSNHSSSATRGFQCIGLSRGKIVGLPSDPSRAVAYWASRWSCFLGPPNTTTSMSTKKNDDIKPNKWFIRHLPVILKGGLLLFKGRRLVKG
jgi:hypothetical protein